jgi:hypothetical protein
MSHLPDKVGQRVSARHNSFGRHGSLGAINRLCRTLEGRVHLETASPASMEAPRRPRGLRQLPR